jgi:Outer membrane protein beta-barrel domain
MNRATSAAVLLVLAAFAGPAAANEFGISGEAGYLALSASKSAQAVFDGSSGGFTGGGSLRYVVGRSFFLGAGARYFGKDGERVFIADANAPVFKLGHPLTFRTVSVYGMVGWRFMPGSSLVPYVAAGAGSTSVKEESTVGGITDSQSQSKFSGHFMGGVEYGRGPFRFGAEVMYTTVPNTIGVGGVSKVYNEKDVGGFSVVGKIVVVP